MAVPENEKPGALQERHRLWNHDMVTLSRPVISLKRAAPANPAARLSPLVPQMPEPLLTMFWFVWAVDGQRPKKRHATLELAMAEAHRLRSIAPDRVFFVYSAVRVEETP
jgi:hypothetical protein